MNNFLPLEESGCVCELVCYLAWVFYQDQTAAWALVTEDSALLSALGWDDNSVHAESRSNWVACVQGVSVKAGGFGNRISPT